MPIAVMSVYSVLINVLLMLFNLLPLPPLDGGRILTSLLPHNAAMALSRVEPYGMFILMGLIILDPQIHLIHTITSTLTHSLSNTILSTAVGLGAGNTPMTTPRKRVLSGMQPSGLLHLGNYLGALENWKSLQNEFECYFFVADWHALSTNYADTGRIREFVRELLIDWLAAGIDPAKATVFVQSRIPEHAVLHLLLSMIIPVAWLERNPTYKEKQEEIKERDLSTYGFLGYPVLQAADILIYKPDFVPVGKDQLPHLELTRELARRFNSLYKPVFPEPMEQLTKFPKVLGTDGRKMSKSYGNTINLSDPEPVVRQKLKTMVTDPARVRRHDPGNPDLCPVYDFHKIFSLPMIQEQINTECRTAAIGCIDCKKLVADRIVERMTPMWDARARLSKDPAHLDDIVTEGSRRARRGRQSDAP